MSTEHERGPLDREDTTDLMTLVYGPIYIENTSHQRKKVSNVGEVEDR